jgi:two-component system catabolic regulation response regulator CreB
VAWRKQARKKTSLCSGALIEPIIDGGVLSSAPMLKPLILIVEDEPGIADTLHYALRTEGFEPAWCASAEAALTAIGSRTPALVILDVGLPDMSGFELFKRLRERIDVPVVFLTARGDEIDRVVGLELGADDYVPKPFSPRELVARVRSVLRRSGRPAAASTDSTARPVFEVDDGRRQIRFYGRPLELSRYEFGLLRALVRRPGHVYTRDALLELVWVDSSDSLDRTVDAHVKTVRAKLKAVAPTLEPIRTHRGVGYALAEDLPAGLPP